MRRPAHRLHAEHAQLPFQVAEIGRLPGVDLDPVGLGHDLVRRRLRVAPHRSLDRGHLRWTDQRRLKAVTPEQLFEIPHHSPQLSLWTGGEDDWLPVLRLPAYAPRRPRPSGAVQPPHFSLDEVGT